MNDARFDWGWLLEVLPWTAASVVVVLGVTFVVALVVGKHAVIDVSWGLGFVAIAATAYVVGSGYDDRQLLFLVLTALWGLRLAGHIFLRSRGKPEDPRYTAIQERATGNPQVHMLVRVYLVQALIMWVVSLPVQVGMVQHVNLRSPWVVAGVVVWLVGFVFETVGDWQLTRFRDDPSNKGKVLDTGLWHYTRHPNYFGDACVWWGLWLITMSGWPGLLFIFCPLLMTLNLMKGTGAKLLEKDIGDRRPEYVDYIKRTSGFFPLPPKKGSPS